MFKKTLTYLVSWKTTSLGILGFLTSLMSNIDKIQLGDGQQKINVIMSALSILLLGIFAKDADKSGSSAK